MSDNIINLASPANSPYANGNSEIIIFENPVAKYECAISLEPLCNGRVYVVPQCGHPFGEDLITGIANKSISKCPICAIPIEGKPYINHLAEELFGDVKELSRENASLKQKISFYEREISVLRNENSELIERQRTLEGNIESLENIVRTQAENFNRYRDENQSQINQLREIIMLSSQQNQSNMTRLEGELLKQSETIDDLRSETIKKDTEIQTLKQRSYISYSSSGRSSRSKKHDKKRPAPPPPKPHICHQAIDKVASVAKTAVTTISSVPCCLSCLKG